MDKDILRMQITMNNLMGDLFGHLHDPFHKRDQMAVSVASGSATNVADATGEVVAEPEICLIPQESVQLGQARWQLTGVYRSLLLLNKMLKRKHMLWVVAQHPSVMRGYETRRKPVLRAQRIKRVQRVTIEAYQFIMEFEYIFFGSPDESIQMRLHKRLKMNVPPDMIEIAQQIFAVVSFVGIRLCKI